MSGSMTPAITTTTIALSGVSPSVGSIVVSIAPPTGAFTDFGLHAATLSQSTDPYYSWVVGAGIDQSSSSAFVRLWVTATAPVKVCPLSTDQTKRGTYAGMAISDSDLVGNGKSYIDHAQFEEAPSTVLLPEDAEGYDTGLFYTLEPGVGALWERSQTVTLNGPWAGHFLQSPAYSGNTYQKVSTTYSSYNQLLAANQTYSDVVNGPT